MTVQNPRNVSICDIKSLVLFPSKIADHVSNNNNTEVIVYNRSFLKIIV